MGSEGKDLLTLQHQQLELEQQRLALKQKEEEINLKIAEKARKELELKKVQLIVKNHKLIEDSLEVYSETLSACDCNTNVDAPKFDTKIKAKPLAEIKEHYINTIIKLSDDFSSKLRDCRKKAVETIATRQ